MTGQGIFVQELRELLKVVHDLVGVYPKLLQIDKKLQVLNVFRNRFRYRDLQSLNRGASTGALEIVDWSLPYDNDVELGVNPNVLPLEC